MADTHAEHPSDRQYWVIAAILGVVTAVEVALSYMEIGNGAPNAVLLLIGMAIKFVLVAGFFMHLKFDKPILRRLFLSGLGLALFCYLVALLMFRAVPGVTDHPQDIHLTPSGIPQS